MFRRDKLLDMKDRLPPCHTDLQELLRDGLLDPSLYTVEAGWDALMPAKPMELPCPTTTRPYTVR